MKSLPALGPQSAQTQKALARLWGKRKAQTRTQNPNLSVSSSEELEQQFETFMQSLLAKFPEPWNICRIFDYFIKLTYLSFICN